MSASDTDADRRHEQRTPIELRVEYKRVNMFFADYTRNISKGGTFIATRHPLELHTEFKFSLVVPAFDEPLVLTGRVVWRVMPDDATEERPAGMGIEFQYANDGERAKIHEMVQHAMTEELGADITAMLLSRNEDPKS